MGSQVHGGLDIPEPCAIQSQTPLFWRVQWLLGNKTSTTFCPAAQGQDQTPTNPPTCNFFRVSKTSNKRQQKKPTNTWVFPKIRVTPKWMVYNGKPQLKWMIWGVPIFLEPPTSNTGETPTEQPLKNRGCLPHSWSLRYVFASDPFPWLPCWTLGKSTKNPHVLPTTCYPIGSMGLVYLPIHLGDFYGTCR